MTTSKRTAAIELTVTYGQRTYPTQIVKRAADVTGAYCPACDRSLEGNQFWDFRKSVDLHKHGTGHAVILFREVAA